MFWGLVVHHDKQYSHKVDVSFHISMAVLEKKSSGKDATELLVDVNGETYVLCRLSEGHPQQQLDLNFSEGEDVAFYVNGSGDVHLTGYNLDQIDDEEDEESESEEEKVDTPKTETRKRKQEKLPSLPSPQSAKKLKTAENSPKKGAPKNLTLMAAEDDSDEELSSLNLTDLEDEELSDEEDYEDLEEEEVEEEESDDSEEDEPVKQGKTPQKKVQTPVPGSGKGSPKKQLKTPVTPADTKKAKVHVATPFPGKEDPETPMSNGTQSEKKKKKKKKNKKENKENPSDQQKTPKKTIKGGIMLEDLKSGTGPGVGKGKWVHIYYEGKLKGSNKAFDSNKEGKGFKFKLGAGEVIKGLEFGLDGMKVGGRRKLTIPPKMGYGHQGAGKDIPPNSTLEFDVELKAVN